MESWVDKINKIDVGSDGSENDNSYYNLSVRKRAISFLKEQKNILPDDVFEELFNNVERILKRNDIGKIYLSTEFALAREKIKLKNNQEQKTSRMENFEEVKKRQRQWNKLGNENLIHEYHKYHNIEDNYIIEDKKEHKLKVFCKGKLIFSCDTNSGASGDDYLTKTYTTSSGDLRNSAGNMSTPAGVFTVSGRGKYKGFPCFTRANENGDIPSSIHSFPQLNNKTPNISNGCTRVLGEDLVSLKKYFKVGIKIFILPEKNDSKFEIRNGEINFSADQTFGGETKKGRKGWMDYSVHHPKVSKPIIIEAKNSKYKNNPLFKEFCETLSNSKKELQEDLGINNDTYNNLSLVALSLAEQESKFGESRMYKIKNIGGDSLQDYFQKARKISKEFLGTKNRWSNMLCTVFVPFSSVKDTEANSKGITQIKFDSLIKNNTKVTELFKKYGITRDNLVRGDKSALAMMILLGSMYTDELPQLKKEMKEQGINELEAILYLNHGKRKEIINKTAIPKKNRYVFKIKRNMRNFVIWQNETV